MKKFLDHIIDDIDVANLKKLKNTCFVFPTQRACRHFESMLQSKFEDNTFWAPTILSIQEFMQCLNPELSAASEMQLITALYSVYKKEEPNTLFEDFYGWGKVLLKDFDEVDRYLVDAKLLYQNLQDIKDIDKVFGPDEEALKAIIEFQKVIDVSGNGQLFSEFEATWKTVGKVYFQFQEALVNKGQAYDGMFYRKTANHINEGKPIPFEHVVFSGFNALSLAEESIFSALLKNGVAHLYFDVDRFYFNEQNLEAAKFLNRYKHLWKGENVHWIDANGFESPRTIDVIGTALGVTQTKIASNILTSNTAYNQNNTAVILADESLLSPVLYALPQGDQPINITMGKPVISHTIGEFIKLYFEYQSRLNTDAKDAVVPVDALKALATNGIIQQENHLLTSWLGKTKQSHISWSWLKAFDSLSLLALEAFTPITSPLHSFEVALSLLEKINAKDTDTVNDALVSLLYEDLTRLKSELLLIGSKFESSFIKKVVLESLVTLKLPLGKETGNGLQVMGFLETRTLDFENLIILSVNESFLPASSSNKSFIPFGLRKAFKMPHFTEQDSIYAYHFYRLLQRAKNVSLIYNTELTVDGSGEKSRYILQLTHRIKSEKLPITLNESTVSIPLSTGSFQAREIEVPKSDEILAQVEKLLFERSEERPISPTLVLDYIECPLRFYLKRIKKIKSLDDVTNEIDPREFGNIVHYTMEQLYIPSLGETIEKKDILILKKSKLDAVIDQAFEREVNLKTFMGKNEYQRYIIKNTLERLLSKDAEQAPLHIKNLELVLNKESFHLALNVNGKALAIGGIIDRLDSIMLDENTSLTRVIDYKTGKVEMQKTTVYKKPVDFETYVDNYFINPNFKVEFQSYYYALIYKRNQPQENITAGIYGLKTLNTGVQYVRGRAQPIPIEIFDLFEERLTHLFEEMLNPNIGFCQTEETKTCAYCDFKAICGR